MSETIKPLFPPRPLGQINAVPASFAARIFGYPNSRPKSNPDRYSIQVDGFQSVVSASETYSDRWAPAVQIDGYQSVVAGFETFTDKFGNHVQVDGFQAVVLALET